MESLLDFLGANCGNAVVALAIWYLATRVAKFEEKLDDKQGVKTCDDKCRISDHRIDILERDVKSLMRDSSGRS